MAISDLSWLSAFDWAAGSYALPAFALEAVAALFVVVCVLALGRSGKPGVLLRIAVAVTGALLVVSMLDRSAWRDHAAERHALDERSAELTARALLPGSALACLDAGAGEAIENACEKTVFASPESAAAAVAYVAARLSLLAEGLEFAKRDDRGYDSTLAVWRRAIELDRYGVAAHVLATRDGCTPENCPAFALLRDASALKANLKDRAFDNYVARYAAAWTQTPAPVAEQPAPASPTATAPVAAGPAPPPKAAASRFEFPSAASIPPVSIMSAEPKAAPAAPPDAAEAPAAAAAPPPKVPVPSRRPQSQAASPPAR